MWLESAANTTGRSGRERRTTSTSDALNGAWKNPSQQGSTIEIGEALGVTFAAAR